MDIYTVGMGGTGMTLAVVLAILFFMKSKQMKQFGKLAVGPGIYNGIFVVFIKQYGSVSVNLNKDGERTIKTSGHWFKQVSENNGF